MNNDNNTDNSVTPVSVPADEFVLGALLIPEEDKTPALRISHISALLRNTFVVLTLVALVVLILFSLWLTVFRMQKDDMATTLQTGGFVLAVKKSSYGKGDIIAFHHNNDILVKRVVALGGDTVIIDESGTLYVNEVKIDEPYAMNPGTGDSDIVFPYEVPEGQLFVLGDNRTMSADSRLKKIGTVSSTLIIGKVFIKVWPFSSIGIIE